MNYLIKKILFSCLIFIALTIGFSMINGCCTFSGPQYKGEKTAHFDGETFHNQGNVRIHKFWDSMWYFLTRDRGEWPEWVYSEPGPAPPERVGNGELRITHVNHSTVLVQFDNINILTDPVWSNRISPISFYGPLRKRQAGIRFEDLPPIDYVVVSHNHYEHMDLETLRMLNEKHKPVFFVPLGNKPLFDEMNFDSTIQLDWWQEVIIGTDTKLTFVPAEHFAMRGLCDRNKTLWGGYVFESKGGPIYFAGDTGFGIHFEQIFQKFGPMRFSMLPIGAYLPREFVAPVHTSPDEAVKAHQILKSKQSMGIHFGTFQLVDDGYRQPVDDLRKELKEQGLTNRDFTILKHGRGYLIPKL